MGCPGHYFNSSPFCFILAVLKPCGVKANHISQMKSNTASHAERELNILLKTVKDPIIGPFKKEIIALCDRFGKSGQSGGSAPFTATALAHAVKTLCMQQPICDITGVDEEWIDVAEMNGGKTLYQNNRCYGVFMEEGGHSYYVDAIVFKDQRGGTFTSGNGVSMPDGTKLGSGQYIKKFPFKPKTFYIDVISVETKKDWWESSVKNINQLKAVFKYYDRRLK